ncbi:hypothetical protein SDRG_01460 [Saprolegnia diclina VS20]|uniref:PDZ domain-containing protein n=1 Tax=Saprolegnia diclina (strain VS20) TaxID=1156394 RepID=T0S8C7_SAPDV|nr:hypothetical protein SDRG_01460 [Saprolegnia diclina VS20]EQC41493.1 hypothetical protein SDRG_01460 [Saprolegnia diclina VS20]|eukprot:XP_008605207.1 hypothetical protein SDRG_01460 [Saprolegnia diclina VS20]
MSRYGGANYDDDDDDMLLKALQASEPCGNCGAPGATIPCSSGCGEVYYCSRECMTYHASSHRLRCRNLRCSKFNDDESDGSSSDESYYDSSDESSEEDEPPQPARGGGKNGKTLSKQQSSSSSAGGGGGGGGKKGGSDKRLRVDSDIERRIEEKIMRRLKKQEENRIAQAIESQMVLSNASWTDADMNRIAMEVKIRLQKEMGHLFTGSSSSRSRKNSISQGSLSRSLSAVVEEDPGKRAPPAPMARQESSGSSRDKGSSSRSSPDKPMRSQRSIDVDPVQPTTAVVPVAAADPATPPTWNNKCAAFLSLKIVVWKLDFRPQMRFCAGPDGTWNQLAEVDADESFSHIILGDVLLSVNGQLLTGVAMSEAEMEEILSENGNPLIMKFGSADPDNRAIREYTVRWGNGPLGLTLKDDGSPEALPIVHRLTKKPGSVAVKENIAIGDVLCAINNIDTVSLGCALTMSVLKKVQLPAKLTFRGVGGVPTRPKGDAPPAKAKQPEVPVSSRGLAPGTTYQVDWREGPLGLTIIPGLQPGDLPVIKRVTGKGTSPGVEYAQVGDYLTSVQGKSTTVLTFEDIVDLLKTLPKPIFMQFTSAQGTANGSMLLPLPVPAPDVVVERKPKSKPAPEPVKKPKAEVEVDIDVPQPADAGTYTIVWGPDGPLGLTIDAIPHETGAYIKRTNGTGAAGHLTDDCIGDEMTHINTIDVRQMEYTRIVAYLKKVPRPVTLHFKADNIHRSSSSSNSGGVNTLRAAPSASMPVQTTTSAPTPSMQPPASLPRGASGSSSSRQYYDLNWAEGSLGLSLHGADDKSEYPYITRVTGVGCAAHLPPSVAGDQLRAINGHSCHTSKCTFNDIMDQLKTLPKPIVLRFQTQKTSSPPPQEASRSYQQAPPQYESQRSYQQPQSYQQPPQQSYQQPPQQSYQQAPVQHDAPRPQPTNEKLLVRQPSALQSYGESSHDDAGGNQLHTPFLQAPKLSSGRRQKIVKQLKK